MPDRPHLAYLVEPAFPGGTSSAVARELRAVRDHARITLHGMTSRMFPGRPAAPVLEAACADLGLDLVRDAPRIAADVVIVHNPSFLKFETDLPTRIFAREIVLVMHENLLRPGGEESHDAGHCLDLLDRATVALRRSLAPISPWNRATVRDWLAARPRHRHWQVRAADWINICDVPAAPPAPRPPRDRRGRHSRPGFEKFPAPGAMDLCFPPHAGANVILGADALGDLAATRPHWRAVSFGGMELADYFDAIDFMVYFTAPTFRESFGRVLAEAIAAGKVVLSDPDTAAIFGDAVVATRPEEVDAVIAAFLAAPDRYADQVTRARARLADFSAESFLGRQADIFAPAAERAA